jgi:hypothetical protein
MDEKSVYIPERERDKVTRFLHVPYSLLPLLPNSDLRPPFLSHIRIVYFFFIVTVHIISFFCGNVTQRWVEHVATRSKERTVLCVSSTCVRETIETFDLLSRYKT